MPQQLFWVREKESGQAFQMHSVDAAEGLALGDYEVIAEPLKDLSSEERTAAAAGMRATGASTHPELQTPEQRAETRRQANEIAAMTAGVPPGAQVVVQVPQASNPARSSSGRFTGTASGSAASSTARGTSSTPAVEAPKT